MHVFLVRNIIFYIVRAPKLFIAIVDFKIHSVCAVEKKSKFSYMVMHEIPVLNATGCPKKMDSNF